MPVVDAALCWQERKPTAGCKGSTCMERAWFGLLIEGLTKGQCGVHEVDIELAFCVDEYRRDRYPADASDDLAIKLPEAGRISGAKKTPRGQMGSRCSTVLRSRHRWVDHWSRISSVQHASMLGPTRRGSARRNCTRRANSSAAGIATRRRCHSLTGRSTSTGGYAPCLRGQSSGYAGAGLEVYLRYVDISHPTTRYLVPEETTGRQGHSDIRGR